MKGLRGILLTAIMIVISGIGSAQQPENLLAVVNGQLYTLDVTLQPFTACQPPEDILGAPIPTRFGAVLLVTLPNEIKRELEDKVSGDGELPHNLWLCYLNEGRLVSLSTQPDNVSFLLEGVIPNLISIPAVSGDSAFVGWVQTTGEEFSLIIHNLLSGITNTYPMTDFVTPYGVLRSPQVVWGSGMFSVFTPIFSTETSSIEATLYSYLPYDGQFLGKVVIERLYETSDFITEVYPVWAESGSGFIAYHLFDGGWRVSHALLGGSYVQEGELEGLEVRVYDTDNDANSVFYSVEEGFRRNFDTLTFTDFNGQPPRFGGYGEGRLALSSDGAQIAFWQPESALGLWDSGDYGTIANTTLGVNDASSIAWGSVYYRLPVAVATPQCPNALPSPFTNGIASLSPSGGANNIRRAPSRSADVVGTIPAGASFNILAGIVCRDGFAWYYVSQVGENPVFGWTVQGDSGTYYFNR